MLRHAAISVMVVYTFTCPAAAEPVGLHGRHASQALASSDFSNLDPARVDSNFEVLDASLQTLLVGASPSDWHESAGADVWRLPVEDVAWQVKVFPAFQFRGAGDPQCCLRFTVGDTEFWVKPGGALHRDAPKNQDASDGTGGSQIPGASQVTGASHGTGAAQVVEELIRTSDQSGTSDGMAGPTDGLTNPTVAGAPTTAASGSQGRDGSDNSATQLPEPGSILLMGLGVAAATRRMRDRRLRNASSGA